VRLLTNGSVLRESAGSDPLLMVALDRPAGSAAISVELQLGGTATRGSDYSLTNTTLIFQPGEVSKSIPLSLLNDSLGEAPESIRVGIVSANGAIVSGPSYHEIVLVDSNAPTLTPVQAWVNGTPAVGTTVTTITATPASGRSISQWQILAGNSLRDGENAPAFSINSAGQVLISNPNSLPLGSTTTLAPPVTAWSIWW
jgi:Calx-beta domain